MRILIDLVLFGFRLELFRYVWEIDSLRYLDFIVWVGKKDFEIDTFRNPRGSLLALPFRFRINLPFLNLTNNVVQRAVEVEGETDALKVVPVVTGKIFGFTIGGK